MKRGRKPKYYDGVTGQAVYRSPYHGLRGNNHPTTMSDGEGMEYIPPARCYVPIPTIDREEYYDPYLWGDTPRKRWGNDARLQDLPKFIANTQETEPWQVIYLGNTEN